MTELFMLNLRDSGKFPLPESISPRNGSQGRPQNWKESRKSRCRRTHFCTGALVSNHQITLSKHKTFSGDFRTTMGLLSAPLGTPEWLATKASGRRAGRFAEISSYRKLGACIQIT